jgi:hypothetical protein
MNRLIKKINPISKIIWQFLIFGLIISIFFGFVLNKAEATNITISGTLYSDAGITNAGSGKTIKIAVGTSTPSVHSTSTETGGVWSITNIDNASLSTTTPITVWLDGDANDAVTLVAGYSSSNITSVPVYYGYTIVNATSSTAVLEVSNFAFYDSSDDSDILYLITSTSTIISSNLLIKQGNFKAPTTTLSVSGNFTNNSTFSANYGTVDMTGSSKEINGIFTGSSAFYDLSISGSYTISSSSASTTNLWIKNGSSLVAPINTTVSGNFSNAGTFNNNDGSLYMDNLRNNVINYISGLDVNGLSNGTSSVAVNTMYIYGNYLYVGKGASATACSQTVGAAVGCELMIFDISSSTNPTYVAGRDVTGSATGSGSLAINVLTVISNYLYVGKGASSTACSQTAGSAGGCELMVFDISSSTNPTYVAGRDSGGSATGTALVSISGTFVNGNYLYVGKAASPTACSQAIGSATGCELMIFDISSSTNPTYVAGRDSSGSAAGTSSIAINNALTVSGNYLYVGNGTSPTACSQTAGSASGCELQVYDISSSTNPTYVAGRDSSGSATGTASIINSVLTVSGNYLYVGKGANSTACSQSVGSATGCELMVFDISSSTNPTYVVGRDSDGSSSGVASIAINNVTLKNNYLYLGKASSANGCLQIIGYANGCELMVFDISSSTNPTYVVGIDGGGSSDGELGIGINANTLTADGYIYTGKAANSTTCSQTAGSATGCELMVFNSPAGLISGELNSGNALANLNIKGNSRFSSVASTSDFTIQANSTSTIPVSSLTLSGDYVNNGVAIFDDTTNLYVASASNQTLSGNLNSFSALPKTIFSGSGTKTISSVASTSDLTINSGVTLTTNYSLSVKGNLNNNGTFDGNETELFGNFTNNGTLSGQAPDLSIKSYITNFLAGRDINGSGSGTTTNSSSYNSVLVGNFLYLVVAGNSIACSQTAGSASGCELQVYDISSSTNPVYVAGRDSNGLSNGTSSEAMISIVATSSYLYIGKAGNGGVACSQTAGSASGCELQVYDISSSTNPVYVAGRDGDGSSSGLNLVSSMYVRAIYGNSLYIGTQAFPTTGNCSQIAGSAQYCELQVYDISSTTNPIYVAGRDGDGSSSGSVNSSYTFYSINRVGNYLYVGGTGGSAACSQTAGSASGCELQVYDISSTTNPIYVAGRDSDGSDSGTSLGRYMLTIATTSQSLIIGLLNSNTACSQTAGSASGCELQVYDISSTTNPIYVAGRDADGSSNGVGVESINSIFVKNNLAYVAKNGNPTTCYNTVGLGLGCELMVFDISSSTNPVFVDSRDVDGSREGVSDVALLNLTGVGEYIYVTKSVGSISCSNSTGVVEGCALQIYGILPTVSGSFTGTNSLGDLTIVGQGANFQSNASTTNFTISTSSTLTAPSYLTVAGDMANYGTFTHSSGTVVLSGINKSLTSPATTTFYNLTKNSTTTDTLTFTAGGTYITKGALNLSGETGNRLSLRSSSSTGEWYIDPQATVTVAYLDVEDSNNINVATITCDTSCLDNGNNTGWLFNDQVLMESTADYHFYAGQATTTLDQIVVTKLSESENITTTNDIRINIATTTSDMRFDSSVTTLTFGGTASGKVNNTVSYEDGNATLVINVTSDFSADDTLTINGIELGDFSTISTTTSNLKLYTSGSIIGSPTTVDTKSIYITGDLVLDDHSLGQVDNVFSFQSYSDKTMFAFSLDSNNENATVTDMVVTLSGIQDISDTNLTDWRLYKDNNNDGDIDGGDTLIDSAGIMNINGQFGAVTFSSDFLVTSTNDYIITADVDSISRGGAVTMSIDTSDITTTGVTSGQSVVVIGSVTNLQHIRNGAGAGGDSARIGDEPPAGNGVVTGGSEGGGGGSDKEEDGENIAFNPNFIKPTATGDSFNEWTNPSNALSSDGSYATANSAGLRQSYNGFGLNIPNGNTIQGIEVKIDASGTTADGTISLALSWDGGSSYTTGKATPTLSGSDIVYSVGDSGDTWGRSWSASEFDLGNFRLRVTATPNSNTIRLDAIEVRVYHQAGGGGAGGGGGI